MSLKMHPYSHSKVVAKIRELAAQKIASGQYSPMFTEKWQAIEKEGLHLTALAAELSGHKIAGHEDALAELFTADARAYIQRKCLNAYWFWYLLSRLNTRELAADLAAVARAHARVKDGLAENRYGFATIEPSPLEHQLKGLPPGFVFEMWHKGRILAEYRPHGEYKTILNPLLIDD